MNIFDYYSTLQFISVPIFLHLYKKYISHFLCQPDMNNSFKNKKSFSKKDYVDCYKNKLDKLYLEYRTNSSNYNDFKHLTNSFIIEYTPKGNVIMKYDYDNNSIDYFCDCAISNDIIRTVFQKFTIVNHCFPLYFGHIEEKDKIKNSFNYNSIPTNNIIKKKTISSKIIEAKKSNVFVKLKQKSKLRQVLDKNDNDNKDDNKDDKELIKQIESKLPGFCTIRNSGKFYNANIFKKSILNFQNTNTIGKKISFRDFKNKIF